MWKKNIILEGNHMLTAPTTICLNRTWENSREHSDGFLDLLLCFAVAHNSAGDDLARPSWCHGALAGSEVNRHTSSSVHDPLWEAHEHIFLLEASITLVVMEEKERASLLNSYLCIQFALLLPLLSSGHCMGNTAV